MPLCPGCHKSYTDDSVICVPCGYNLKTGQFLKPQQSHGGIAESGEPAAEGWITLNLPGVAKPKVLGPAALVGAVGAAVTLFAIYMLISTGGEMIFGTFCIAFVGVAISAQSCTFLLTGELLMMNNAFVQFESRHWTNLFLMLFVPFAVFFTVLKLSVDKVEKQQKAAVVNAAAAVEKAAVENSEYTIKSLTLLSDELNGARGPFTSAPNGSLYVAVTDAFRVFRIDPQSGSVAPVAGTGNKEYKGDGKAALSAGLNYPLYAVANKDGDVFIFDSGRVRKIDGKTGMINSIAGASGRGESGGGLAKDVKFGTFCSLAFDDKGNLLIADADSHCIFRLDQAKSMVDIIAGGGKAGFSGDGGPATAAQLNGPRSVAIDKQGNLYFADRGNNRVRKIDKATGNISTIAGSGASGHGGDDGPATSAKIGAPLGIAIADNGDVYITSSTNRIYRVNASNGTIKTIAGSGRDSEAIEDGDGLKTGDGGLSLKAPLSNPSSIALLPDGSVIFGDARNSLLRKLTPIKR